jgi:hypothetical protein
MPHAHLIPEALHGFGPFLDMAIVFGEQPVFILAVQSASYRRCDCAGSACGITRNCKSNRSWAHPARRRGTERFCPRHVHLRSSRYCLLSSTISSVMEGSLPVSCSMFIGDRRTRRPVRAFRSPANVVIIPKDAILHDVRTSNEPGYRFPIAMRIVAQKNPSMHMFEYQGETLYMHFVHGLMGATTGVDRG